MVEHIVPATLAEALEAIADGKKEVIAGGTDLMVQRRKGAGRLPDFPDGLVYLFDLDELKYVRKTADALHIGAMTPLEELLKHPHVPNLLKTIIAEMASPALRRVATIAGNIANASPAGDSLIYLYLIDANVKLISASGERSLPIHEIITGPKTTCLTKQEIIVEITIPIHRFTHERFKKIGPRRSDAISKASFAAAAFIEEDIIRDFRVAFGAVSATVVRCKDIEETLKGTRVDALKEASRSIIERYASHIRPIDDQRSNKVYRKTVSTNLLADFIATL